MITLNQLHCDLCDRIIAARRRLNEARARHFADLNSTEKKAQHFQASAAVVELRAELDQLENEQ